MTDRSRPERSAIHSIESGSADHGLACGSDQRITRGSLSLLSLAAAALFPRGADQGADQAADRERSAPADQRGSYPQTLAYCSHVAEEWLREWYAEHSEVVCARCWLQQHKRRRRYRWVASIRALKAAPATPPPDAVDAPRIRREVPTCPT